MTPSQGRGVGPSVQEKRIHQVFVVSVAAKGLHALIEIAGGLALYLFSSGTIGRWIDAVDPHEWIARHLDLSDQRFFAFYLLSHGVLKAAVVVASAPRKAVGLPGGLPCSAPSSPTSSIATPGRTRSRSSPSRSSTSSSSRSRSTNTACCGSTSRPTKASTMQRLTLAGGIPDNLRGASSRSAISTASTSAIRRWSGARSSAASTSAGR